METLIPADLFDLLVDVEVMAMFITADFADDDPRFGEAVESVAIVQVGMIEDYLAVNHPAIYARFGEAQGPLRSTLDLLSEAAGRRFRGRQLPDPSTIQSQWAALAAKYQLTNQP